MHKKFGEDRPCSLAVMREHIQTVILVTILRTPPGDKEINVGIYSMNANGKRDSNIYSRVSG